jgi:hypothetical protein
MGLQVNLSVSEVTQQLKSSYMQTYFKMLYISSPLSSQVPDINSRPNIFITGTANSTMAGTVMPSEGNLYARRNFKNLIIS